MGWRLTLILLIILVASCNKPPADTTAETASTDNAQPAAAVEEQPEVAAPEQVKQFIIMYSGDTISAMTPPEGYEPPQGGLPALAGAVAEYQRSIVYFNQLRVADEGGDPSQVRADREAGLLGEHPFVLLDYGGWERPNDYAGAPYVALYLNFFKDYQYTAVGSTLYSRLTPERWEQYAEVDPGVELLASAGLSQPGSDPLDQVSSIVRDVHGATWCICSVPLPAMEGDPFAAITEYIDQAWSEIEASGATYSILMFPGGPKQLYRDLAEEGRFTVIIGAPVSVAARVGIGEVTPGQTLLLPELNPSGRQLGICHLKYAGGGDLPTDYNLLLNTCLAEGSDSLPYQNQVQEALAEHDQLVAEHETAAKIGNP